MTFRKAPFPTACAVAALLAQACVEYIPENPAPQAPPPAQPAYAPPAQPEYAPPAEAGPPPSPPAQLPAPAANSALRSLLAPIALYPDPLIALILPASAAPNDLSAASSYLVQYGDPTQIDRQPWDPSVRALAHYPTLVSWMVENMAWTQALGSAFVAAPGDVMDAVQQLRAEALRAGTLTSGAQQRVVTDEEGEIDILPSQPDSIYIPQYDPQVVYTEDQYYGYGGPFINYGDPFPMGFWLSYSFDWRRHRVWEGDRGDWREHQGWNKPRFDGDHPPAGAKAWGPRDISHNTGSHQGPPPGKPVPAPRLMPGTPNPPPSHYRRPNPQPNAQPGPRTDPRSGGEPRGQPQRAQPPAPTAPARTAPTAPVPAERPRLNPVQAPQAQQPTPPTGAGREGRAPGQGAPGPRTAPERPTTGAQGGQAPYNTGGRATQGNPGGRASSGNPGASAPHAPSSPPPSQPAQAAPQAPTQSGDQRTNQPQR